MCFQPDLPDPEPLAPTEPIQSLAIPSSAPPPAGLSEADAERAAQGNRARIARRRGIDSLRIESPITGTGLSIK